MKRVAVWMVSGMALWMAGRSASADVVVNLNSSGLTTVEQGLVTAITISASNAGTAAITLGQLQLGIQLVPQGTVTGDVTGTGFSAPATNSPWTDPSASGPTFETLTSGAINGTTDYYLMSITENDPTFGTIAPGESRNLGTISFTTTNDALGTWLLYVVNESDVDTGTPLTSITTDAFETVQFDNLVAPAGGTPGVAFQVAAITVIAPVPEPSTFALAGIGLVAAVWAGRRRKNARRS